MLIQLDEHHPQWQSCEPSLCLCVFANGSADYFPLITSRETTSTFFIGTQSHQTISPFYYPPHTKTHIESKEAKGYERKGLCVEGAEGRGSQYRRKGYPTDSGGPVDSLLRWERIFFLCESGCVFSAVLRSPSTPPLSPDSCREELSFVLCVKTREKESLHGTSDRRYEVSDTT